MKKYYTIKLKLTPKQVDAFNEIRLHGSFAGEAAENDTEAKRVFSVEGKIGKALEKSGYYNDRNLNEYHVDDPDDYDDLVGLVDAVMEERKLPKGEIIK